MDKLSKAQKDEFATSFAILALYDGGVSSNVGREGFPRISLCHHAWETPIFGALNT